MPELRQRRSIVTEWRWFIPTPYPGTRDRPGRDLPYGEIPAWPDLLEPLGQLLTFDVPGDKRRELTNFRLKVRQTYSLVACFRSPKLIRNWVRDWGKDEWDESLGQLAWVGELDGSEGRDNPHSKGLWKGSSKDEWLEGMNEMTGLARWYG